MRIFIAGATGAIGKRLVPLLVERGHEVVGMTRSEAKADLVRSLGARPAVADGLDADAVGRVVAEAEPEVVVHQLTALADAGSDMRHFDRAFEPTNRLRTEGSTSCSRPPGPWARAASWRRASPAGRTPAKAAP